MAGSGQGSGLSKSVGKRGLGKKIVVGTLAATLALGAAGCETPAQVKHGIEINAAGKLEAEVARLKALGVKHSIAVANLQEQYVGHERFNIAKYLPHGRAVDANGLDLSQIYRDGGMRTFFRFDKSHVSALNFLSEVAGLATGNKGEVSVDQLHRVILAVKKPSLNMRLASNDAKQVVSDEISPGMTDGIRELVSPKLAAKADAFAMERTYGTPLKFSPDSRDLAAAYLKLFEAGSEEKFLAAFKIYANKSPRDAVNAIRFIQGLTQGQ